MNLKKSDEMLLKELARYHTLREASKGLRIPYSTLQSKVKRWRDNQVKARLFVNTMLGYRKGSVLLSKILKPNRLVRVIEDEEEDED